MVKNFADLTRRHYLCQNTEKTLQCEPIVEHYIVGTDSLPLNTLYSISPSSEYRIPTLSGTPAAYVSSVSQTASLVSDILGHVSPHLPYIDSSLSQLSILSNTPDGSSIEKVLSRQRLLSRAIDLASFEDLCSNATDTHSKALALSSSLPHVGEAFSCSFLVFTSMTENSISVRSIGLVFLSLMMRLVQSVGLIPTALGIIRSHCRGYGDLITVMIL